MTRGGQTPTGLLDGKPFDSPRELEPGPQPSHFPAHRLDKGTIAVIWARAVTKGYSPFHLPASLNAIYNLQAHGRKTD